MRRIHLPLFQQSTACLLPIRRRAWLQRMRQAVTTLPPTIMRAARTPGVQYRIALLLTTALVFLLSLLSLSALPGPHGVVA